MQNLLKQVPRTTKDKRKGRKKTKKKSKARQKSRTRGALKKTRMHQPRAKEVGKGRN